MSEEDKTLDWFVDKALDFIKENRGFELELPGGENPLVVGSGNAYYTGRAAYRFAGRRFIHAEDVQAKEEIDKRAGELTGLVVVSASGSRDIIEVAKHAVANKIPVHSISCNHDSELKQELGDKLDQKHVPTPSEKESPTVNTVTYGMMLYGVTHECPEAIRLEIEKIRRPEKGYNRFEAFSMLFPDKMLEISRMTQRKFDEIFGRKVRVISANITNFLHGAAVHDEENELYVGIGLEKKYLDNFGADNRRFHVPLPGYFGPLGYMMVSYSVIGHMQRDRKDFSFLKSIKDYPERERDWIRPEL